MDLDKVLEYVNDKTEHYKKVIEYAEDTPYTFLEARDKAEIYRKISLYLTELKERRAVIQDLEKKFNKPQIFDDEYIKGVQDGAMGIIKQIKR